jgi:hypothetical protein
MSSFSRSLCAAVPLVLVAVAPVPARSSDQIGPGASGSIGSTQGVNDAKNGASKRILDHALTPQTRQTLQEAMDSESSKPGRAARNEVSLGPGEAAQLKGRTATKIDYGSLPKPVQGALGGTVHHTLKSDSQHD